MSGAGKLKNIMVVCAAAGLVITTSWGTVSADQVYTDSTVGISSAFDRYADKLAKSETAEIVSSDSKAESTEESLAAKTETTAAKTVSKSAKSSAGTKKKSAEAEEKEAAKYPDFEGKCLVTAADYVNIRSDAGTDAEIVGILESQGMAVVEEKGAEWTKVTSGSCTGYISNDYLVFGDEAGAYAEENCSKRVTVATETLNVRAEADKAADCVTLVGQGQSFDILSEQDGWVQIAVDDSVTGYVSSDYVEYTYDFASAKSVEEIQQELEEQQRQQAAEAEKAAAEAESSAADNSDGAGGDGSADGSQTTGESQTTDSSQTTSDSQTSGSTDNSDSSQTTNDSQTSDSADDGSSSSDSVAAPSGQTGIDLANYAVQFVGNPYVYGGSSLTNGADCSGFVMAVYAQFGYSLPHSAGAQSNYGVRVDTSSLEPGDILFYGDGYSIGHCAIYIGGGMIVHASTPETGIKTSSAFYRTPMCAVRIIGQ